MPGSIEVIGGAESQTVVTFDNYATNPVSISGIDCTFRQKSSSVLGFVSLTDLTDKTEVSIDSSGQTTSSTHALELETYDSQSV